MWFRRKMVDIRRVGTWESVCGAWHRFYTSACVEELVAGERDGLLPASSLVATSQIIMGFVWVSAFAVTKPD